MLSRLDPIIALLTLLLVFLVVALFVSEIFFASDAQFFQSISAMATGVMGALLGLITGKGSQSSAGPPPQSPPVPPQVPMN